MVGKASNMQSNTGVLNMGTTAYVQDSRIRMVVERIYFHPHTEDWNYTNAGTMFTKYVTNDFDNYGLTEEDKTERQHVLLKGGTSTTVGGRASGFGYQGYLHMAGYYMHLVNNGYGSWTWRLPGHLNHEMSHACGLIHNFHGGPDGYQGDDCDDNDPEGLPCPIQASSNNYMDYFPGGYNSGNPDPGFSVCQLGRMHYRLDGNTGTIHRVVLKDHCAYDPTAAMTVTGDHLWTSSKKLKGDLIITPGSTLSVKCRVHIPHGGKVVVKQGGRLIIDEGQFTNLCDQFWGGIEVWGNSNEHQYPSDHPTHQGLLVLKNGAVIEHAREASRLWKPGDWNSMGGVIQVQGTPTQVGATFINCRRSAEFMKYQNFQPGNSGLLRNNLSFFRYAQFRVDDNYRGGDDFEAHVTLWGVDGLQFRACSFENTQTTVTQSPRLGEGIGSFDASYTVSGNCTVLVPYGTPCPPENMDRGKFTGLGHGLDSRDGGTGRGFNAGNLDFANNIVSIYAAGLPGFTATRNTFVLGDRHVDLTGDVDGSFYEFNHRGISTQGSFGFRIEENTFSPAASIQAEGLDAIVIENSGPNSTEVYKNSAAGMTNGYIAEGNCIDYAQASAVGHQFICNTNESNEQNFWVRKDGQLNDTWNHAERTQQGSNEVPAGNLFDQGMGDSDYRNETAWVINYWHAGGASEPMAVTPGYVGVTLASGTNNCPSRLNGKEVKLTAGLVQQTQGEFQTAKTAYVNTAYVFSSLIDGGNTAAAVQEVEESWPAEAWDLRNYLMSKSPYLSTAVLVGMMQKNILPQAMVLEICLANPEATKKEGFTKWAEYEAPSPMPAYMIDLIAGSWEAKTFRMELEAQIGQHHAAMTVASDMLQASYRAEEENIPLDAMLAQWNQMPNYGARYAEAQVHIRKGQYGAAKAILEGLAARYPMKEDREAERDRTIWYIDQLQSLALAGRNEMQLTEAELPVWQTFAETANDIAGGWATNLLCFGYKICIDRPGTSGGVNKALHPTKPGTANVTHTALTIAPNPAGLWVTFSHTLAAEPSEAQLRVLDVRGREVALLPLNAVQGQTLWDTREVPAGVYSIELLNAGGRIATERLIVQPVR